MSHSIEKIEYWRPIVQEFKRSGLSQLAFCREHGLEERTFRKWQHLFEGKEPETCQGGVAGEIELVPLQCLPTPDAAAALPSVPVEKDCGIVLQIGKVTIKLSKDFDAGSLSRVLSIAGGVTC